MIKWKKGLLMLVLLILPLPSAADALPFTGDDIELRPSAIEQGEVAVLSIQKKGRVRPEVTWREKEITLVLDSQNGKWAAFLGADLTTMPGMNIPFPSVNERLLLNSPSNTITMRSQEAGFHVRSLVQAIAGYLDGRKRDVHSLADKLKSLSPLSILKRGYSLTRRSPDMTIIKDSAQVSPGNEINILLAHGALSGVVTKTDKGD